MALARKALGSILIAARDLLLAERRSVVQVYLSRERLAQAAQAEPGCLVALLPAVTPLGVSGFLRNTGKSSAEITAVRAIKNHSEATH